MTRSRAILLELCKTIDAPREYINECKIIARYGTELEVKSRIYEIDETIGGRDVYRTEDNRD